MLPEPQPITPIGPVLMRWPALALCALLLVASGCGNNKLLTREDYQPARIRFAKGDYQGSLAHFPKGEADVFITTLEKAYLNLLLGKPAIDALIPFRTRIEDRIRFVASRELKSLFYVEMPEGYYASEHEIVWLHLLLSWGYSQRGAYEKGCVEARQASHLLTARWSEQGHFDDPLLRVILGVLWAYCGSWEDAAVDFRVAAKLDPSLSWAAELAKRERPPRNLMLVLGGSGVEPQWNPTLAWMPLRGARKLGFATHGRRSPLAVKSAAALQPLHRTPFSTPWYQRHQIRDNAIAELIADSRYGAEGVYEVARYSVVKAAGVAYWVGATLVGVGVGGAIIYGSAQAQSGEGMLLGLATPILFFGHGKKMHDKITAEGEQRLEKQLDPANFYRFVRFLPEYAWVGWRDDPLPDPLPLVLNPPLRKAEAFNPQQQWAKTLLVTPQGQGKQSFEIRAVGGRHPRVYIGHIPDLPEGPHSP